MHTINYSLPLRRRMILKAQRESCFAPDGSLLDRKGPPWNKHHV